MALCERERERESARALYLSCTHTHTHTQDHQEPHYPVYYSSGKPINPVAGNSAASDSMEAQAPKNPWEPGASNVFGAGGKIYQYPGRGGTR